jgi:type VI secretion system protein
VRLILTLTGEAPSGAERMRTLTAGTLSIGRGAGNDWVLPDPARVLSKIHCVISIEGGRVVLTNVSSNGVFVNDAQHSPARDGQVVLTDGDRFRLGDYVIHVTEVDDGPGIGPAPNAAVPPERDRFGGAPIGGFRQSSGPLNVDPLDDPLFRPLDRPPDTAFQHPIAHLPARARPDDPFDLDHARQTRPAHPDEDLYRGIAPSPDWHGAPRPNHVPAPAQAVPPPRVLQPGFAPQPAAPARAPPSSTTGEIDFDALLGDLISPASVPAPRPVAPAPGEQRSAPGAPPIPRSGLDPFGEAERLATGGGAAPPAFVQPAPAPSSHSQQVVAGDSSPPVAPLTAPAAARGGDGRAAFAAFLEGAGVAGQWIEGSDPEAALRAAGEVFRALAEGVRELLISRAAIKGEMRILQTMIRSHDNNGLKFSVTPNDAVTALLSSGRPGYMDPLAAAKEAFHDIKLHELAVLAGMQTALLALLKRFDPDQLEQRLTQSRLNTVLPAARKARFWDAFRQTYGEISREAEDDFHAVFGRAFAEAYNATTRHD